MSERVDCCQGELASSRDSMDVAAIVAVINTMQDSGVNKFDPARFAYIQSLANKLSDQPALIAGLLVERLVKSIAELNNDFRSAQQKAQATIRQVALNNPQLAGKLESVYKTGDLRAIERLVKRTQRQQHFQQTIVALQGLTHQLSKREIQAKTPAESSIDDFLQAQEQEMLEDCGIQDFREGHQELRALKYFRESWVKDHAERVLEQAVQSLPTDAGPLNSQKLAIKSLAAMQELSPEYVNRFVSYMDTLLWLEQQGMPGKFNLKRK